MKQIILALMLAVAGIGAALPQTLSGKAT